MRVGQHVSLGIMLAYVPVGMAVMADSLNDELCAPVNVIVGNIPLDVARQGHAAPFFADVDGDGRRDLLVGQYSEGKVRLYLNVGRDFDPSFESYHFIQADGTDASVPFG